MCRLIYRLVEEAVAKGGRKSPESDRQAIETLAVPRGPFLLDPLCQSDTNYATQILRHG